MRDRELYAQILGIQSPWKVKDVELELDGGEVRVEVVHAGAALPCPCCGKSVPGYDTRRRRWRHLDTCQYRTILIAEVPRVECPEHGVKQIEVPWAEEGSGFTALFERVVIDWLREASIAAVSRRLAMTWDEVDGIMSRADRRGLARRAFEPAPRTGVDETSFQKRHEYVTIVSDLDVSEVLYVADDRKAESLDGYFEQLSEQQLERIEVVAMDMWAPYLKSVRRHVPEADDKIVFDRFHVAKHLGDAVDRVRRAEHKELRTEGDDRLKGSRYLWLQNPATMSDERWHGAFDALRRSSLRTARAWAIKEAAAGLWEYRTRGWARRGWKRWLGWAKRSRLDPIKKVAQMVERHLGGIINAVVHRATNAGAESINAKIQRVKRMACGFRNRDRFRNAIYFHLGGLDLYPVTHTDS
jgi:transposase